MEVFSPKDARQAIAEKIPFYVFDVFNEMLSENWNKHEIRLKTDDIIARIINISERIGDYATRFDIIDKRWLNIEPFYGDKGWIVKYERDSHPYYDSTPDYFVFIPNE